VPANEEAASFTVGEAYLLAVKTEPHGSNGECGGITAGFGLSLKPYYHCSTPRVDWFETSSSS
jgi:hypothetical protein